MKLDSDIGDTFSSTVVDPTCQSILEQDTKAQVFLMNWVAPCMAAPANQCVNVTRLLLKACATAVSSLYI